MDDRGYTNGNISSEDGSETFSNYLLTATTEKEADHEYMGLVVDADDGNNDRRHISLCNARAGGLSTRRAAAMLCVVQGVLLQRTGQPIQKEAADSQ